MGDEQKASYIKNCQLIAIYEDNAFTQKLSGFLCRRGNVEVVTNKPLLALCPSKLPKKSRIAPDPILFPAA